MQPKVLKSVMTKRYSQIMKTQSNISLQNNKSFIGKSLEVIIDNYDFDKNA